MAISGISGSTSTTSSVAGSQQTLAGNFDTFLQILTTQLKNQNPLDPLDTNQFTSQLVQFSSVEQQLKTNQFMEALLEANQSNGATDAVSYIGKTVTTSGTTSDLVDGKASWALSLPEDAEAATVTIKDSAGNVVFTDQGSMPKGDGEYSWDGVKSDGGKLNSGTFTISISATNTAGSIVPVKTAFSGSVSGVDLSGTSPVLMVGERRVPVGTLTSVKGGA